MNLTAISNNELMQLTEKEIRNERNSTLKIIKHFQEIYDRKLFLEFGFSSFYDMATKHFGYCAGSAMRRINAMKLVREMPQFEEKLESGELSLSVAADVQTFLYQEAKIERPYSLNAKIELVESCVGKSRREVEMEFARRNPEREMRESVHAVSHDRLRVSFSISKELNDKLNHLKDLLGHVDATMTMESLLDRLAELGLEKYDPSRKAARARARKKSQDASLNRIRKIAQETPRTSAAEVARMKNAVSEAERTEDVAAEAKQAKSVVAEAKRTRYIAADEKYRVPGAESGCAYEANGRRCGATKFLQLDHIEPFAHGGANTAENLRWMCGAHNRFRTRSATAH
jgi:hypothetical protein